LAILPVWDAYVQQENMFSDEIEINIAIKLMYRLTSSSAVVINVHFLKNGVFWVVTPCGSLTVLTRATRRNNPEDTILHSHRRENLKSYNVHFLFTYLYM
jgi:hypothetical protein